METPFDIHGQLRLDVCEKARQRRDPAYDGVFFVCVRTTGIYCRPVCRARMPLEKNVNIVASAAAAEAQGYRPCLRCRPESVPWSPAWIGTEAVVRRALGIIDAGYLDEHNITQLADRVGLSARHLNRLFRCHVGASPNQVAITNRLHKAKRLISDTDLTFQEIAFEAGFGSVKRFNEVIRSAYGRPPSGIRKKTNRVRYSRLGRNITGD